jgi:hypothetical protein
MYRFSSDTHSLDTFSLQSTTAPADPAGNRDDGRRQLLASLLADNEWQCDPAIRSRLQALHRCLQPVAGADAREKPECPAESEWTLLANETERYLDFRRLRHIEAQLQDRSDADFHFDHHAWQVAHAAEAALAAHLRQVHEESYVPEQDDFYLHVH